MNKDKIFLFLILVLVIGIFLYFGLPRYYFERGEFIKDLIAEKEPVYSKGIYITFPTAATSRIDGLLDLVKRTELNTAVIDIKDVTGRIPFNTDSELIHQIGSERNYILDIKGLVKKFHKEGIYVIARVVVFEDNFLPEKRPDLALKTRSGYLWRDFKGLTWLDPASREVWDYNIEVAKEAVRIGFDEINLDYIRFPSDGDTSQIVYPFWDYKTPKKEVIRQFFEYFSQRIKSRGVFISADLFGLTLTSETDLNIGQWLEDAGLYFDYICPMVYPSHYPEGYEGFENPAIYPYEVIYKALRIGMERLEIASASAKLRPWLQDFDMGAIYDARMINLEKKAAYDAGAYGWLLWNPKNIYTEGALEEEKY
ncbi:MAG: putative glycoside hydrolase [Patescibacteria group bacterium]